MTARKYREFDPRKARQAVYLDFEGEGKSSNSGIPLPHMAGIFRPKPDKGGSGLYEAIFFKESWKAPKNGSHGKARIAGFEITIENLISEVTDKDSYIVYWSIYEHSVMESNLPLLLDAFEKVSFNLLPPLRKIKNRRGIKLDPAIEKTLNQYMKAFLPNRSLVQGFKPGPAEACRRIDNCSIKTLKWRNWPNKKKEYVRKLLDYNEQDCRATWLLGRKLGNINSK